MVTSAERKALLFLAGLIALGAIVRVVRWERAEHDPASAAALATQIARVDSARGLAGAGRARGGRAKKGASAQLAGPVDLDRADAAEIQRLPGIGPVVAARVVAHRDSAGAFGSLESLLRVKGIGRKTAERLAPHVTFSGVARPSNAVLSPESAPPERRRARRATPVR